MHDLVAELHGYRNELAAAHRYGHTDRAEAVAAEIERVTADIRATAEHLDGQAAEHDKVGQHTLGAHRRAEAARLRKALDDGQAAAGEKPVDEPPADEPTADEPLVDEPPVDEPPAAETAADSTPRETATTARGKRRS